VTREEILARLTEVLIRNFDVKREAIRPDAHLFEELDLDSIDAIDLVVTLEEETDIMIEESELRELRLIQDVVSLIQRKLEKV